MRGPSDAQASSDQFETLYRGSYQAIFAYVLRRTNGDAEIVADLVAEVFVVALRKQDAIPPPPQDRLWLYGVARRIVLDHHRRRKRLRGLLSLLQAQATREIDPGYSQPSRLRVQSAMEKLRSADQEVLQLIIWDGMSHAEAAQVLGCTSNAVALRLHKAKSRLRHILSADAGATREFCPAASPFAPDGSRSHL
jgi:RNA polymerase sigma-70 factor (ECF subfamily)